MVSLLFLLITSPVNASPVLPTSLSSVVSFNHQCNDHAVLLCNLSFSTDLKTLENPEVTCQTLYTNTTQTHLEETVQKEWTFFTELGTTVYKVEANLTMDTTATTASISSISLCFSNSCSSQSQTCLSFSPTTSPSSFTTNLPMTSSSESSYLANSNAEGFVFNMGEGGSSSSESSYLANSNAEGFVFNMGEGESSSYLYSSNPEGFVFNFGGQSSSSAHQEVFETNATSTLQVAQNTQQSTFT